MVEHRFRKPEVAGSILAKGFLINLIYLKTNFGLFEKYLSNVGYYYTMKKELIFLLGAFEGLMIGIILKLGFDFGHDGLIATLINWMPFKDAFLAPVFWGLLIFAIVLPWVPVSQEVHENTPSFITGILIGFILLAFFL